MFRNLIENIDSKVPFLTASAHSDIPCKIYDPQPAIIAALTVVRMLDLMKELSDKGDTSLQTQNTMVRYIREKEDQASLCKKEIRIIWGDYFKKPQIESFPNIHELTHSIMMAAGKAKQESNREFGTKLVELVNNFADIFWQSKGIKTKRAVCPYPPSLEVVYPDL